MSLAALAICGLLIANLNVKAFDGVNSSVFNPIACFNIYETVGTQHFTFCNGCEERTGSDPEMSSTCGE